MSEVRFTLASCDSLLDAGQEGANRIRNGISALAPLVAEAHALLDWTPHQLHSPLAGLHDAAIGLTDDRRDLEWRVEFVRRLDGSGFPTVEVVGMPEWTYDQAQQWYVASDIEVLWQQQGEGTLAERQRARRRLEELIAEFSGTDDPAAVAAVIEGLRQGEPVVIAVQRSGVRMQQAAYIDAINELAFERDLSFEHAELLFVDWQQQIVDLMSQGYSPAEAQQAVMIADQAGFDIDAIAELASVEGIGLADALALQARAHHYAMTVPELHAFDGLTENFAAFDNPQGGDTDDLVSLDDLRWVVANPNRFTTAEVAAAHSLLANPGLLSRLDTGRDNNDVLNDGDRFGDTSFDDGKISLVDLESFEWKQGVNALVGTHYENIDIANGGTIDGHLSKADFEKYLADNRGSLTETEVRALEVVIDGEFYDKGWLERNKRSIAIATAVVVGAGITLFTGGLGSGVGGALITMAVTGGAGAATAGATTLGINAYSDESDWDDDLAANSMHGFMGGMAGGGLGMMPSGFTATAGNNLGRSALFAGGASDVAGVAGMGGFDWAIDYGLGIHSNELTAFHEAADAVSIATGVTGLGLAGVDSTIRWANAGMAAGTAETMPGLVASGNSFTSHGISEEAAEQWLRTSDEGQSMFRAALESAIELGDFDEDIVLEYLVRDIGSGVLAPEAIELSEPLIKLVPTGEAVGSRSPFWMTLESYESLKTSGRDVFDALGLPYLNFSDSYDAWMITAVADNPNVFASQIAPTTELLDFVKNSGGVEQVLVPNRLEFSEPTLFEVGIERAPGGLAPVREVVSAVNTATDSSPTPRVAVESELANHQFGFELDLGHTGIR